MLNLTVPIETEISPLEADRVDQCAFMWQHIRIAVDSVYAAKLVADEFHTRLFRNAGALTGVDKIVPQRVGAVFSVRDMQFPSNDTVKALRNGRTPESVLVCMQFTKQLLGFAVLAS